MKAAVLRAKDDVVVSAAADPVAGNGEVVVALRAAALNHRDVWIKAGQYAGVAYPTILGSDGAGVVDAVGEGVDSSWVGHEVIINPSFDWGSNEVHQGPDFSILGLPRAGTLATKIAVPAVQLGLKPANWTFEEAAALPLAGLTAYRALHYRAKLKTGERVLISGIGGGVAVFALQFALAMGAKVWVTSSSPAKIARAVGMGASGGFDYNETGWAARAVQETGGFDVIIDSAGGSGFDSLLDAAAQGGRIAIYGGTRGAVPNLPIRKVFWKQLSILGTTMGSPQDWAGLIELVTTRNLRPVVSEVHSLEAVDLALKSMEQGVQFGKIVVRTS